MRLLFVRLPLSAYALILAVLVVLLVIDIVAPSSRRCGCARRGVRHVGAHLGVRLAWLDAHRRRVHVLHHSRAHRPRPDRAPTTASAESAAGLSPQQLAGINLLVSTYGQTQDPVQAAAVAWAVKAIANREETLHAFGYPGDSLAGAVHWTLSALAPQHDRAVQERAVAYYDEATRAAPTATTASGSLAFSTDAADHRNGTVRVDASSAATGTVTLVNAVFAESGIIDARRRIRGKHLRDPQPCPPAEGRAYTVSGIGRLPGRPSGRGAPLHDARRSADGRAHGRDGVRCRGRRRRPTRPSVLAPHLDAGAGARDGGRPVRRRSDFRRRRRDRGRAPRTGRTFR